MRGKLIMSFVLFLLLFCFSTISFALDVRSAPTVYGLKAGVISPGIWYVGDFEYEPDIGYSLGGFLDHKLGEKITGGIEIDVHGFNAYETSSTLIDFGISLRAILFSENSNLTFKPGIGIGYGNLGVMDPYEASSYFVLKGGVDLILSSTKDYSWLAEISLIGSPDGGNDDTEMYLGTGFLVRAGIVF